MLFITHTPLPLLCVLFFFARFFFFISILNKRQIGSFVVTGETYLQGFEGAVYKEMKMQMGPFEYLKGFRCFPPQFYGIIGIRRESYY